MSFFSLSFGGVLKPFIRVYISLPRPSVEKLKKWLFLWYNRSVVVRECDVGLSDLDWRTMSPQDDITVPRGIEKKHVRVN